MSPGNVNPPPAPPTGPPLDEPGSTPLAALDDWTPEAPAALPSLSIDALAPNAEVPSWLRAAAVTRAVAPSLLDRVAAAGLLARLWSPARSGRDVAVFLDELLAGEDPPTRAARWFAALPEATQRQSARAAVAETRALYQQLGPLAVDISADPIAARAAALSWIWRRDDLECVAHLHRTRHAAGPLDRALAELDRAAATHLREWLRVAPFDDERLLSVATAEPDTWWTKMAGPVPRAS
jgi:hypothetical protein